MMVRPVRRDFEQLEWGSALEAQCRRLVQEAVREDLDRFYDWTTLALVPEETQARAAVVARQAGVVAGLPAAVIVLDEYDRRLAWHPAATDGQSIRAGQCVARVEGPARSLLTAERPLLNLLGHLSGIATLTAQYVEAVQSTAARVYDTRKTLPGWRWLEKYAVRAGGGHNHRLGLYDAILIKDNHLACGAAAEGTARFTPAEAVARARTFAQAMGCGGSDAPIIEIEVDSLDQLAGVLAAAPDLVLLDNFSPAELQAAVHLRDERGVQVELEASGGVRLETIAAIAASGVERISVGALTHSARWFDFGLDWEVGG